VVEDGNVLIDGGIMDNFPVGVMAALSDSTRIIGVHVSPYKVRLREYDYDTSLSGWRLLVSRLNPFSRGMRAPSLAYIMMRAAEINGVRLGKEDEALTDLLIVPDVSGFRNTQYDQWRAIAERGYDAAIEPLRAWAGERLASRERAQPGATGP
jgi:predicted acylesterase/phospholipase RssA